MGTLPDAIAAHEGYIAYAQFEPARLDPLDFHDLLYWEIRVARWATVRMQECDLSHRVLVPFNQRDVIEGVLAIQFPDRKDKDQLERFARERLGRGSPHGTGHARFD